VSLRFVVTASRACVAAAERQDWSACIDFMTARDEAYKHLGAADARAYIEWAFDRMPDAEMDLLIGTRAPEHDAGDEDRLGAVLL
jgi:hypothetical protein